MTSGTETSEKYDGYIQLGSAIVLQAVEDYERALADDDKRMIADCEKFFKGEWCKLISPVDGEYIMMKVKKGVKEFIKLAKPNFENGKKQHAFLCPICGGKVSIINACVSIKPKICRLKAKCECCGFYVMK